MLTTQPTAGANSGVRVSTNEWVVRYGPNNGQYSILPKPTTQPVRYRYHVEGRDTEPFEYPA